MATHTSPQHSEMASANERQQWGSQASLVAQTVKNPPANAGDLGWTPGLGGSPGEGNGNPLQILA